MIASCSNDVAREFLRMAHLAPARPDATFLAQLTRAFVRFPYENMTKIVRAAETGDPLRRLRTPEMVFTEHLALGAGGTCFSLTNFFEGILKSVGFESQAVLCDRSYGPDTHCALIVSAGGARYLVDPGYFLAEPLPVPERGDILQRGPRGALRLSRLGESRQLLLVSECRGRPKIRYRLRDEAVSRERFIARWIDSFGWAQMRHLCVSRQTDGEQFYLRDRNVRRLEGGGVAGQGRVGDDFAPTVEKLFGIDGGLISRARDALSSVKEAYRRERCGRDGR